MNLTLPADLQNLVDEQIATGHFASSDDVLREALQLLSERQATLANLEESLQDIEAGRVRPLGEVADEIRRRHGWAAP